MKLQVTMPTEIDIKNMKCEMAVRYGEEDIPNDFPLREGDMWIGIINVDNGIIKDWPIGKTGELSMKVCDEGIYTLYDSDEKVIATKEGYVPACIPSQYGDYVRFSIDENGKISDWDKYFTKNNIIESFFPNGE